MSLVLDLAFDPRWRPHDPGIVCPARRREHSGLRPLIAVDACAALGHDLRPGLTVVN